MEYIALVVALIYVIGGIQVENLIFVLVSHHDIIVGDFHRVSMKIKW